MLVSSPFRDNARLNAAATWDTPIARGETGRAVLLLQAALTVLGYALPISTGKLHGVPDGRFGDETVHALRRFQRRHHLDPDGRAGRRTLAALDALLPLPPPPPPPPPVVPPPPHFPLSTSVPYSADFKFGIDDPKITPDAGAGKWNSVSKRVLTAIERESILEILPIAAVALGPNAARHMKHYLSNTGKSLTIDLEGMVANVPSAKRLFDVHVAKIRAYAESLPPGVSRITSSHAENGYNDPKETTDWYFAVGGYSTWTKARVTVSGSGAGRSISIDLEYKFYDRYNWDGDVVVDGKVVSHGKNVTIAGIVITDQVMGDFHRQGLAMEYDMFGSFKRSLNWMAP